MLHTPMDVLKQFPVRKTKEQKRLFREAVIDWAKRQGYPVTVEYAGFGVCNVVIGDAENADYLVTACVNSLSAVITILEIARTLQENQRHKVCFVLFDQKEKGLLGSRAYRKAHKAATERQFVIHLDCVGDGDVLRMYPTPKLKKDRKKLTSLYTACGYFGKKSLLVEEKGSMCCISDYRHFPMGVCIMAMRKGNMGLYLGKIHTRRDTVLEETNVNILRAALTTYICRDAAQ